MFKPKKLLLSALFSLIGLCFPASLRAQFIGDVGLQTVNQKFTVFCNGAAQTFSATNIGAISHQATVFFPTATAPASVSMEIDGYDGVNFYKISNPQISFANTLSNGTTYVVQASGYYPEIIVSITCTNGAIGTLTYAGAQSAFSSIIGPQGGTTQVINGGIAAQVQGIVTQQQSAGTVDPIILGGLELPVNTNFLTVGIDNFNTSNAPVSVGSTGPFPIVFPPVPSKSGEFGVAFEANLSDAGTGTSILSPWTCAPALPGTCGGGSPQMSMAYLANVAAGNALVRTFSSSTPGGQDIGSIVLLTNATGTAAIRQDNIAGGAAAVSFSGNTLANSTLLAAVRCSGTAPCTVSGVTDTQGHTWLPVTGTSFNNGSQASGLWVWAPTTLSTAAADTITFTLSSGTAAGTMAAEITGTTASSITQPAVSLAANPIGSLVVTEDAQFPNQFVCSVTLSTATTTQCQVAPTTINGIAVRAYVTDVQVNTTATGTGSAVQLVDGTGTNCGTATANLSAITYSTVTAAAPTLLSMLDFRTPLFAPLQSAVCVKQTGTPATVTVEVHGYFAP
jgi:hypothetical protein